MKVAFHVPSLDARGNGSAVYDYAHYNETILGNESMVIFNGGAPDNRSGTVDRYLARFGPQKLCTYNRVVEIDPILREWGAEVFYCVKSGEVDIFAAGVTACRHANHAVFQWGTPHGHRYAYVSPWLAELKGGTCVPPIIHPTKPVESLRAELKIPESACVFGRHGGWDSFDVLSAREAVAKLASEQIRFVFLSTEPFCDSPYVTFLPTTDDLSYIDRFILTCDAMLHGRKRGETFGVSPAQFNAASRYVFSWAHSEEKGHFDILGSAIVTYAGTLDCITCLSDFAYLKSTGQSVRAKDVVTERFSPAGVMRQFNDFFLS